MERLIFYPSKTNNRLNRRPFPVETINGRAMLNPHYPVTVAPGTRYIIDSGAFQERDMRHRLEPWYALERQLRMEAQIEFAGHTGRAEALVTYDMIDGVDEALTEHGRVKQRGTECSARPAVAETLRAARYYATQTHRIAGAVAYACQGASTAQYVACAEDILPLLRPGVDWFAFGGFCIVGQIPRLKPQLYAAAAALFPVLAQSGVPQVHILGVTVSDALLELRRLAAPYPFVLSTDSSGPERNAAVYGKEFVTTPRPRFVARYTKADKFVKYHPADWALTQIRAYHDWMTTL